LGVEGKTMGKGLIPTGEGFTSTNSTMKVGFESQHPSLWIRRVRKELVILSILVIIRTVLSIRTVWESKSLIRVETL